MSIHKNIKLNHLLASWPPGLVRVSKYLSKNGYTPQLMKRYVKSQWVRSLYEGAYVKLKDEPSIYGVLNALREQSGLAIHLGGVSALEYYGYAQYYNLAPVGPHYIYVSDEKKQTLAKWAQTLSLKLNYVNKHLFRNFVGLEKKEEGDIAFTISRPERAILELLSLVPKNFSMEFASENLENLQGLDPRLTQELLEQCSSIKVKRLFLYLAEEKGLPCFKKLNIARIDLGKGKRVIGEGGNYSRKYGISVPVIHGEAGEDYV